MEVNPPNGGSFKEGAPGVPVHRATFRLPDAGPYAAATADATAAVELWCNDHSDLLVVRGPDADRVLARVADAVGVRESLARGDALVAVTERCARDEETPAVEEFLAAHGALLLAPYRYADGAKECRVLALSGDALGAVFRDLAADHPVEVVEKTDLEGAAPAGVDPVAALDLSPRQREALRAAHRLGYYEIPRAVTTADVADELGVARRTAEEHLRRAENQVVDALLDA